MHSCGVIEHLDALLVRIPARESGIEAVVDLLDFLIFLKTVYPEISADAGHFVSAPRTFHEARVVAVDPGDTCTDLLHNSYSSHMIICEYCSGKTVIGIVCQCDSFFFSFKCLYSDYRSEYFFPYDTHIRCAVVEYSRSDKEALVASVCRVAFSSAQAYGAFFFAYFYIFKHIIHLTL